MIEFTMEHWNDPDTSTRQRAGCACWPTASLMRWAARMSTLGLTPDYDTIRAPGDSGCRSRHEGGTGERFFAGDATLTRAVFEKRHAGLRLRTWA